MEGEESTFNKRVKREGEEDAIVDSEIIASGITNDPLSGGSDSSAFPVGSEITAVAPNGAATESGDKPKKKKQGKSAKDKPEAAAKANDKDKEFEVPLAAINKILRAALPEGTACSKDAKSAFSKAAGIFVLYITACANDMAKGNKRQTISGQDITSALSELGYASFLPHLDATMEKMKSEAAQRKHQKEATKKKSEVAASTEASAAAATSSAPTGFGNTEGGLPENDTLGIETGLGGGGHDGLESSSIADSVLGGSGD